MGEDDSHLLSYYSWSEAQYPLHSARLLTLLTMKYLVLASCLLLFTACGQQLPQAKPMEVVSLKDGDTYDLRLSSVQNRIADKNVTMYAYNGSVPGPVLKVPQGARITFRVQNAIDVMTFLHPHGVRTENGSDGTHLVQAPITPGETYTQQITFPDPGIYWYHTHMDEARQQELGLFGAFIVMPKDAAYWPPVAQEEAVIVDDMLLDDKGIAPFSAKTDRTLMGRYGNTMLVNGQTDWHMQAQTGQPVRLYMLNVANTRTFNLTIPGALMRRVGADDSAYEHSFTETGVLLAPSERAVVDVLFPAAGAYSLRHEGSQTYTMGTIDVTGSPVTSATASGFLLPVENAAVAADMVQVRKYMNTPADKSLRIDLAMQGMMAMNHDDPAPIEWEDGMPDMNAMSDSANTKWQLVDEATGSANMAVHWIFHKGDMVKIRIANPAEGMHHMQHPIHLHGNRFVVLKRNGEPETNLAWKDTVLVKSGETVEILADMSNPGKWMLHCHIAEHLDDGMMILYDVE